MRVRVERKVGGKGTCVARRGIDSGGRKAVDPPRREVEGKSPNWITVG